MPSLHNSMDHYRREWMVRMIERDNRMVDVNIMRNAHAELAVLRLHDDARARRADRADGYVQQTLDVVSGLPFTMRARRGCWR